MSILVQGSEAWKQWRRNKIGSSDAAVLMGVGFITPHQLWLEKTYGLEKEKNTAMMRGTLLEPIAREWFIKETGIVVEPNVFIHKEFDFAIASVDGVNEDQKILVEIKCPGAKVHAMALNGKVPEYYYPQLQHQLAVLGYDRAYYVSFDGENGVIIEVMRDNDYIEKLMKIEQDFYQCMIDFEEPPLTERDFVDRSDDDKWASLADEWKRINAELKAMKTKEEKLRKSLIDMTNHQPTKGNGLKVHSYLRKGSVDYNRLCQDSGINADLYRGEPIECWKLQEI